MYRTICSALFGLAVVAGPAVAEPIFIDNAEAILSGTWVSSTSNAGFYGTNYVHNNQVAGSRAVYTATIPTDGVFTVWARWTSSDNRTPHVGYTIDHADGSNTIFVDQRIDGSRWVRLGDFSFTAGSTATITLDTAGTTGYVIADAIAIATPIPVRPTLTPLAAYASSSLLSNGRSPGRVIDGSGLDLQIEPMHVGTDNGNNVNWLSAQHDTAGWFKVDLGASYTLESMDIYNFSATNSNAINRGVKTFDLYVSTVENPSNNDFANNPEWTLVQADVTLNMAPLGSNNAPDLVNFAPNGTEARWVAFDITSNYGNDYVGLGEVLFYTVVPEPGSLAALAGVCLAALSRRRRHRCRTTDAH